MDTDILRRLARAWHGIELGEADAQGIQRFLAGVEQVAETESKRHDFHDEPARDWTALEVLADKP